MLTSTTPSHSPLGRTAFQELIAPAAVDDFLSQLWCRRAAHFQVSGRTFEEIFSWRDVNAILNSGGLTVPKVMVVRAGQELPSEQFCADGTNRIDPQAVVALFEQGATFIITRADSHSRGLRRVAMGAEDLFLERVNMNVYCSPSNIQGVDCHYDTHEVFVLQVEGAKQWKVFAPTVEAPVEKFQKADAPIEAAPYLDVTLRKGDVLYVPRGHWHYAVAVDEPSLHVTIGIRCRTGRTFLDWLSADLMSQPFWRRNLPLPDGGLAGARPDQSVAHREFAAAARQSLVAALDQPDLFDRFWSSTREAVVVSAEVNLPLQLSTTNWPLDDSIIFERPAARRHTITVTGPSAVTIVSGACEIALENLNPTLVERIFDADAFSAADVQRWDPFITPDDARNLLSGLVQAGLLVIGKT